MYQKQSVSGQHHRKPGVDDLLSELSKHGIAERKAKRQRLIYIGLTAVCILLVGLQFL